MTLLTETYLGPFKTSMMVLFCENNPSYATGPFLYPLKTENLWFSDVFRGIERASGMKWVNG